MQELKPDEIRADEEARQARAVKAAYVKGFYDGVGRAAEVLGEMRSPVTDDMVNMEFHLRDHGETMPKVGD